MTYTPVVDISTWQESPAIPGDIDFTRMATQARGVIIKRSQGLVADPDGARNYQRARGIIRRGAYHYQDWSVNPVAQADFFWEQIRDDVGELAPWWDYEHRTGAPSPGQARELLRSGLERLTYHLESAGWDTLNRPICIYTAPLYWAQYGSRDIYWVRYDLAIANYNVSAPAVPRPWYNFRYWQYTDKGNGLAHGVESMQIDLDHFDGDQVAFEKYAKPLPGAPIEPPKDEVMAIKFIVISEGLRVRSEPNTNASIIGALPLGTAIETTAPHIYAPSYGGECWAHFDKPIKGWSAIDYGSSQHMRTA